MPQYCGPFNLVRKTAENDFEVQDPNGKTDVINIERFKRFVQRAIDPQVNSEDKQESTNKIDTKPKPRPSKKRVTFNTEVKIADEGHISQRPLKEASTVRRSPRLQEKYGH